ncbi:MYXO-CTERM domain-containing protein [Thermomonospora echinospora]|uniref:MYXO-CTERM domain-containing protein n=1 Tax=Thermomonospora echinospora TaxID=1992 RepID=A0A1H6CQP6_9ACTN|nr:DUF3618 domain-containing protein [Thermomonospora echinospora]SEG75339.1 MYXO-CTERM domain-containing protein [Thermomonospora echinospora]
MATSESRPTAARSQQNGSAGAHQAEAKDGAQELRTDIERTRAELGETVEALASKADVKTRAKDKAGQFKENITAQAQHGIETVRDRTAPAAQKAQEKTRELAAKARETSSSEEVRAKAAPGGAAAAAGTGAAAVAVWLWRRRRARRTTRWQAAMQTAQQAGVQVRDQLRSGAAGISSASGDLMNAQVPAKVAAQARTAMSSPTTRPRVQGAAAAALVLLAAGRIRRRRARKAAMPK